MLCRFWRGHAAACWGASGAGARRARGGRLRRAACQSASGACVEPAGVPAASSSSGQLECRRSLRRAACWGASGVCVERPATKYTGQAKLKNTLTQLTEYKQLGLERARGLAAACWSASGARAGRARGSLLECQRRLRRAACWSANGVCDERPAGVPAAPASSGLPRIRQGTAQII